MRFFRTPLAWIRVGSLALCLGILLEPNTPGNLPAWVLIPDGTYRLGSREKGTQEQVEMAAFEVTRYEITVQQFAYFLNATYTGVDANHPDLVFRQGLWMPRSGLRHYPITHVRAEQAMAYAEWLGLGARLPSLSEWEVMARGGIDGAPFPWGWGGSERRARFAGNGPGSVGQYSPNGFGVYDAGANVFEYALEEGAYYLCGGSWAERSEEMLKVFIHHPVDRAYADRDTGFRILRAAP